MEPIEDVIARAEQRAVEEWEREQNPPPPFDPDMDLIDWRLG
jgi:hypothetical protein